MPFLIVLILGGVGLALWASSRQPGTPQLPEAPPPEPPQATEQELASLTTPELIALVGDTQSVLTGSDEMAQFLDQYWSGAIPFDENYFQELYMNVMNVAIHNDIQYDAMNTFGNAINILMTQRINEVTSPGIPQIEQEKPSSIDESLEAVFGEESIPLITQAISDNDITTLENYVKLAYAQFESDQSTQAAGVYAYLYDQLKAISDASPQT